MSNNSNTVTLNVGTYNTIKNDSFRYALFLDNLLQGAELTEDEEGLIFDTKKVEEAVKFVYAERYKKKISTLKRQRTLYGKK